MRRVPASALAAWLDEEAALGLGAAQNKDEPVSTQQRWKWHPLEAGAVREGAMRGVCRRPCASEAPRLALDVQPLRASMRTSSSGDCEYHKTQAASC